MSKKFTNCCQGEKEHSGFNPLEAWHVICGYKFLARHSAAVPCQGEKNPMAHAVTTRSEEPLPLGTAMLSHLALSLFMWNIALRIAGMLLALARGQG
jgi:hypothetical protein